MKRLFRWSIILLGALVLWSGYTENPSVWPVRNTLEYHVTRTWWNAVGEPDRSHTGSVAGAVMSADGMPVPGAVVALSEWDGRSHFSKSDTYGRYEIKGVPNGFYRVAATAPGFVGTQSGGLLRGVTIRPGSRSDLSFRLTRNGRSELQPLPRPKMNDPQTLVCKSPVPGTAYRETLSFSEGAGDDLIFLYRPANSLDQELPVLLTVYPGPVDTWECVSIGLAQAGYAVVAIGPSYGLELTKDVDTLEKLASLVKKGDLPGTDSARLAALGGSYSALLLELLMLREPGLEAVVLLGPPTDMFDFRRRFEREGFLPPFGLDRALVALGLPSREPLRYLNHSMVHHVRPGLPATVIFHSYQDEIVPYQQSELLAESLRRQGVETELNQFDGASHYLLEDSDAAQTIYLKTLDFLSRHGMAPFLNKGR